MTYTGNHLVWEWESFPGQMTWLFKSLISADCSTETLRPFCDDDHSSSDDRKLIDSAAAAHTFIGCDNVQSQSCKMMQY